MYVCILACRHIYIPTPPTSVHERIAKVIDNIVIAHLKTTLKQMVCAPPGFAALKKKSLINWRSEVGGGLQPGVCVCVCRHGRC